METQAEDAAEETEKDINLRLDADGNIASGVVDEEYGHITWVIDSVGNLKVEGVGDFSNSSARDRAPWYNNRHTIFSVTINVKEMIYASYMFYGCSSIGAFYLAKFDTSHVTNMWSMFDGCNGSHTGSTFLVNINVSNFNTSKVTDMSDMFYGCSSLYSLDVSNFDTSKVTSMRDMFYG